MRRMLVGSKMVSFTLIQSFQTEFRTDRFHEVIEVMNRSTQRFWECNIDKSGLKTYYDILAFYRKDSGELQGRTLLDVGVHKHKLHCLPTGQKLCESCKNWPQTCHNWHCSECDTQLCWSCPIRLATDAGRSYTRVEGETLLFESTEDRKVKDSNLTIEIKNCHAEILSLNQQNMVLSADLTHSETDNQAKMDRIMQLEHENQTLRELLEVQILRISRRLVGKTEREVPSTVDMDDSCTDSTNSYLNLV